MGRLARLGGSAALAMAAAGCVPSPDVDQTRLCRIALVALADRDAHLTIQSQSPVFSAPGTTAVRIAARASAPGAATTDLAIECRFAADSGATPDSLVALRLDGQPLSPTALHMLKRFWLASPDADAADPQPIAMWRAAPALPPVLAHGLQNGIAALPGMAIYGLLAAAYALVYGLVGRINLAFGAFAAVGGAASLTAIGMLAHPGVGAIVAATFAAAAWAGTLHGVAAARWVFLPLARSSGQQGLVATVGLALVIGEYLRIAQGSAPLWFVPLRAAPIGIARSGDFVVTVTPLAALVTGGFLVAALLLLFAMARTQFGRNWRAMADDARASALMGVDPVGLFGVTFALASALAAIAGAVTVLLYGSFGAGYGTVVGLKALLAAVLGGIGSVPGALLGGIAIAVAEVTWSAFFAIEDRDLALFIALSATLVVWPGGFFGFRDGGPRRV